MIEKDKPVRVEDFSKISALVKAYELQPGKHYLVIADKRDFSFALTHNLLNDLRDNHPELDVFIIAVPDAKKIDVAEKKEDETSTTSGT